MTAPDTFDQLRTALAGRYRIERQLGMGGMATVYLAEDLKHHRKVAIKVLRPELAASIGPTRFLQEIRIAAGLSHPNLLPVHDSGEAHGKLFYVMPFVEGESLADRLKREGPVPPAEAVRMAADLSDALHVAHQRGIIHRDIKPANILLQHGRALLADFGIARAVDAAGGESVTQTGFAVGTPAYMSPEQALGGEVDARTDVYALGVVLYEMLSGRPPFDGATPQAVMVSRLTTPPPPLSGVRPVPRELDAVVTKALERDADQRYTSAADLAIALRGADLGGPLRKARPNLTRVGFAAGIVAAVGMAVWLGSQFGGRTADGPPAVVVLPFENLGPASEQYFADGLTEEITSRLGTISGLRVVSRTTALAYAGGGRTVAEIGSALNVGWVLEGTVRSDGSGDRVRVTPQLIRVADDSHVWTDRFTVSLDPGEVFAMQAGIAEQVAEALDVTVLSGERDDLRAAPTTSEPALRAYLLGRYHWHRRTPADLREAARLFGEAITADSGYAAAWAGLADAMALFPFYGLPDLTPDTAYARAERSALRALALDSTLAEARASLGYVWMYGAHDWAGAERELRKAIAADPSYATAHMWLGERLAATGELDSAVAHTSEAARLDPMSPAAVGLHGVYLGAADRLADARTQLTSALELAPGFAQVALILGLLEKRAGNADAADQALAQAGLSAALRAAVLADDVAGVRATLPAGLPAGLDDRMIDALLYAAVGAEMPAIESIEAAERAGSQYVFGTRGFGVHLPYADRPRVRAALSRLGL